MCDYMNTGSNLHWSVLVLIHVDGLREIFCKNVTILLIKLHITHDP